MINTLKEKKKNIMKKNSNKNLFYIFPIFFLKGRAQTQSPTTTNYATEFLSHILGNRKGRHTRSETEERRPGKYHLLDRGISPAR